MSMNPGNIDLAGALYRLTVTPADYRQIAGLGYAVRQYTPSVIGGVGGDHQNRYAFGRGTRLTNCKNCGAPLKCTACEYCDTRYL